MGHSNFLTTIIKTSKIIIFLHDKIPQFFWRSLYIRRCDIDSWYSGDHFILHDSWILFSENCTPFSSASLDWGKTGYSESQHFYDRQKNSDDRLLLIFGFLRALLCDVRVYGRYWTFLQSILFLLLTFRCFSTVSCTPECRKISLEPKKINYLYVQWWVLFSWDFFMKILYK